MLQVVPNRYETQAVMDQFSMDCLAWSDNGYAHVTLRWADETEVDVEVRAPNRQVDPGLFAVARAVLVRLAAIDNIVQRQCAGECERSGLHSMHYESLLARIFIASVPLPQGEREEKLRVLRVLVRNPLRLALRR